MKTLVIGYGNTLRSDDGVGPLVAEQVDTWNLLNVRSLSVHQLTPELAADIAQVETVFFIDAWQITNAQSPPNLGDLGGECEAVETFPTSAQPSIERIFPSIPPTILDHAWSPSVLLHLVKTLYNADPVAYQICIPAIQFDYGEALSAIAHDGADWIITKLASELRPNFVRIVETQIAEDPAKSTFPQSHTAAIRSPPD
jgi:hydrogenase maturation protease